MAGGACCVLSVMGAGGYYFYDKSKEGTNQPPPPPPPPPPATQGSNNTITLPTQTKTDYISGAPGAPGAPGTTGAPATQGSNNTITLPTQTITDYISGAPGAPGTTGAPGNTGNTGAPGEETTEMCSRQYFGMNPISEIYVTQGIDQSTDWEAPGCTVPDTQLGSDIFWNTPPEHPIGRMLTGLWGANICGKKSSGNYSANTKQIKAVKAFMVESGDDSCPAGWITVKNQWGQNWDMRKYQRGDTVRLCYQTESVNNPCDDDGAPRDIKLVRGDTCDTEEIDAGGDILGLSESTQSWRVCAK